MMGGAVAVHKASVDDEPALGIAGRQHAVQQSCKRLEDLALGGQVVLVVGEAIVRGKVLPVIHYDAYSVSG